jgi:hypothetical protein
LRQAAALQEEVISMNVKTDIKAGGVLLSS